MFKLIQPYIGAISIGLILGAALYVGYLNWRISDLANDKKNLQTANAQLTSDIMAANRQIAALAWRDTQNKNIEASYETQRKELKTKANGPVSPVLRYAVDADIVR